MSGALRYPDRIRCAVIDDVHPVPARAPSIICQSAQFWAERMLVKKNELDVRVMDDEVTYKSLFDHQAASALSHVVVQNSVGRYLWDGE